MDSLRQDPRDYALRFLEGWNRHDTAQALTWLSSDCVWEFTVGSTPAGTRYEGVAAIGQAFDALVRAVPDLRYELVDCHAGENHLVMEVLVTGNNKETGALLRFQACDILVFRDDKVMAKRSYRKVIS